MTWSGSFEELAAYLRRFVNIDGAPVPFDFGGVLLLWLALLDNLRTNGLDAELDNAAEYMSPEQIEFLLQLADRVRHSQAD